MCACVCVRVRVCVCVCGERERELACAQRQQLDAPTCAPAATPLQYRHSPVLRDAPIIYELLPGRKLLVEEASSY